MTASPVVAVGDRCKVEDGAWPNMGAGVRRTPFVVEAIKTAPSGEYAVLRETDRGGMVQAGLPPRFVPTVHLTVTRKAKVQA